MRAYLKRIDAAAGMARFYVVTIQPTLFGEWAVVREWGRIGQGGTVRDRVLPSEQEARSVAEEIIVSKARRGYRRVEI